MKVGLDPNDCELVGNPCEGTDTERRPCADGGTEWRDVSTSPGMLRMAGYRQELAEAGRTLPWSLQREWGLQYGGFRLRPPGPGENGCLLFSACGLWSFVMAAPGSSHRERAHMGSRPGPGVLAHSTPEGRAGSQLPFSLSLGLAVAAHRPGGCLWGWASICFLPRPAPLCSAAVCTFLAWRFYVHVSLCVPLPPWPLCAPSAHLSGAPGRGR